MATNRGVRRVFHMTRQDTALPTAPRQRRCVVGIKLKPKELEWRDCTRNFEKTLRSGNGNLRPPSRATSETSTRCETPQVAVPVCAVTLRSTLSSGPTGRGRKSGTEIAQSLPIEIQQTRLQRPEATSIDFLPARRCHRSPRSGGSFSISLWRTRYVPAVRPVQWEPVA